MVYGENGEQVTAYNIMLPDDELKVNAKAIAALPDLLAALEACLLRLYNDDEQLEPEYLQASEALIKAGYTF